MHVRVIETGHHQLPARINDARARTGERFDLGARAHCGNAVARDRDSFRERPLPVHGVDGGVEDKEIGHKRSMTALQHARKQTPTPPEASLDFHPAMQKLALPMSSIATEFKGVTAVTKANVYLIGHPHICSFVGVNRGTVPGLKR
jgi:hypothetical protein